MMYHPILVMIVPGPRVPFKQRARKYLFKLYVKIRSKLMSKYLHGPNGSVWKRVRHIPQEGEERGILRYNINGIPYRNEDGKTWQMIERGRDTWASANNWKR